MSLGQWLGALGVIAMLGAAVLPAQAFDESKYPDFKGQWNRAGTPRWLAPGQKAPLTPDYQTIFEANLADMANGGPGDWPSTFCIPQGMPAMMDLFDPMEVVITPDTTYILISHINDSYRPSTPTAVTGRRRTMSSAPTRATRSGAGSILGAAAAMTRSR